MTLSWSEIFLNVSTDISYESQKGKVVFLKMVNIFIIASQVYSLLFTVAI